MISQIKTFGDTALKVPVGRLDRSWQVDLAVQITNATLMCAIEGNVRDSNTLSFVGTVKIVMLGTDVSLIALLITIRSLETYALRF
jgi:hypothetical protein